MEFALKEFIVSISFILILALGWQQSVQAEGAGPSTLLGSCNNDYLHPVRVVKNYLTMDQLTELALLVDNGDPLAGWRFLAELGDSYAGQAAKVLDPNGGFKDRYYRQLIQRHWRNTVGSFELDQKFNRVARLHFYQYARVVLGGQWPDSDQVLLSYLTAVRKFQLPDIVVFDAAWDAAGMNQLQSWQDLNELEGERQVFPTQACFVISSGKAKEVILKDLVGF